MKSHKMAIMGIEKRLRVGDEKLTCKKSNRLSGLKQTDLRLLMNV